MNSTNIEKDLTSEPNMDRIVRNALEYAFSENRVEFMDRMRKPFVRIATLRGIISICVSIGVLSALFHDNLEGIIFLSIMILIGGLIAIFCFIDYCIEKKKIKVINSAIVSEIDLIKQKVISDCENESKGSLFNRHDYSMKTYFSRVWIYVIFLYLFGLGFYVVNQLFEISRIDRFAVILVGFYSSCLASWVVALYQKLGRDRVIHYTHVTWVVIKSTAQVISFLVTLIWGSTEVYEKYRLRQNKSQGNSQKATEDSPCKRLLPAEEAKNR